MTPMMILVASRWRRGTNEDAMFIFDCEHENFAVEEYEPHPAIKPTVADRCPALLPRLREAT
jgi:hypothetical protein